MDKSQTLNYKTIGTGKPVVFLHGFLESNTMWEILDLETFPFQSILIDLPGHGQSSELPAEVSIPAMADAVLGTLKEMGISGYSIVGHSMGGYIALQMAKTDPTVGKVCLMNSSFWADSEKKKTDRDRVIGVVKENKSRFLKEAIPGLFVDADSHPEFVRNLIAEAENMSTEAIVYATAAMRDRASTEDVAIRLDGKLKIVQGEKDKSIPLEDMLKNTQGKAVNLAILPDVAHMTHVEANESMKLILTDFLARE